MKLTVLCLLMILSLSFQIQAQKKYDVTIKFSPSFDIEKAEVYVDRGTFLHQPYIQKRLNKIHISNGFQSSRVAIEIRYPRKNGKKPNHRMGFFISDKPAEISFSKNDDPEHKLGNFKTVNAIPFEDMGAREYNSYIESETHAYWDFINLHGLEPSNNSTTHPEERRLLHSIFNKSIEFIKIHKPTYYSFWAMRNRIGKTEMYPYDSLMQIYQRSFPKEYKESYEGRQLESRYKQSKLTKNMPAPAINTHDIHGNFISLDQFRGTYLLLNFWASWCRPCIKEFPALQEIYDQYSERDLDLVLINTDFDSVKFHKAREKYQLDFGYHIPRNSTIIEDYGVRYIPRVFLISPNGHILYTRHEESDDVDLSKLKALLSEKLGGK